MERKQGTPYGTVVLQCPRNGMPTLGAHFAQGKATLRHCAAVKRAHDNKQKLCVYLILSKRIFNESSAAFAHDTSIRMHVCVCVRNRDRHRGKQ